MRIVAGSAGGVRLARVPAGTRPLSDRAREGLFSSLGDSVVGARVLDLFAGTGACGIEALSRGATAAVFVETSPTAVAAIRENLLRCRLSESASVRRIDAFRVLRERAGGFDLVLLDPPYRVPGAALDALLAEVAGQRLVSAGGHVVLTRRTGSYEPVIPIDWRVERRLAYGDAVLFVFQVL